MNDWPPSSEEVVELPVDELGMRLLRRLSRSPQSIHRNNLYFGNNTLNLTISSQSPAVWRAIGEAYDWLIHNGLLANNPGQDNHDFAYVTERGKRLLGDPHPLRTINATIRMALDLHPVIAKRVRSLFILGEYESAVFLAFREVEIRVRDLGGFQKPQLGVDLMRLAFSPKAGKLIDPDLEGGELQATADLFAGAIGAFKNPSSHRQVDYENATVAAEAVLLADLLHRILDRYDTHTTS